MLLEPLALRYIYRAKACQVEALGQIGRAKALGYGAFPCATLAGLKLWATTFLVPVAQGFSPALQKGLHVKLK